MRVAMDARFLTSRTLRGMGRYVLGLAGELARQGVAITLFHRAGEGLCEDHLAGLPLTVHGLNDYGGIFWEQISVPVALLRGRFDLYHAPGERAVPYVSPCPAVLTYHSTTTESYRALVRQGALRGELRDYLGFEPPRRKGLMGHYHWLQQFKADHVLAPSEFCRDELVRLNGLAPTRITAIPLAASSEFLGPRQQENQLRCSLDRMGVRQPYLLYVGGYECHKNVAGLLEVFRNVCAKRPGLQLVCVGSAPPPEELLRTGRQLPDKSVLFLASLSKELVDLYDGAELFITMSWRETFCLPALEAMTRGIPVVASEWGAAREVVGDGGVLIDPRNSAAAAGCVDELLGKKERRSALSVKALAQSRRFSWQKTAAKTLAVYERLLKNRRSTPWRASLLARSDTDT